MLFGSWNIRRTTIKSSNWDLKNDIDFVKHNPSFSKHTRNYYEYSNIQNLLKQTKLSWKWKYFLHFYRYKRLIPDEIKKNIFFWLCSQTFHNELYGKKMKSVPNFHFGDIISIDVTLFLEYFISFPKRCSPYKFDIAFYFQFGFYCLFWIFNIT